MASIDIRDKAVISHEDIIRLNFIRDPSRYVFRKHFREGLRSRLMQVLSPADVAAERTGIIKNNVKWYPLAPPLKMLRIFKEHFQTIDDVQREIQPFKMVQKFMPPESYAASQEFLVSYLFMERYEILLCGLQEYIDGESLDPWREDTLERLRVFLGEHASSETGLKALLDAARASASSFVDHIKAMVTKAGYIPDLAGVGNIRITADGLMKLVDINNISRIFLDHRIRLDDKGYPVSDKSVEALSKIERYLLERSSLENEALYRLFLDSKRMSDVRAWEKRFHESTVAAGNYPALYRA